MAASILTNTSAMVALQTLRTTNKQLGEVNNQISTGKKVASAKDSAAVFAISTIMESDVAGFKALNESLSLGESTVGVASSAANSIGNLLNEIKGKIIAANEDNVDRSALQTEIVSLRDQITSIVDSAQFNGLNLIDGSNNGANGFSVLASLNRAADGNVTTGSITFDPTNSNLGTATGAALVAGLGDVSGAVTAGTSFDVSNQTGTAGAAAAEYAVATGLGTLRATDGGATTDGIVIGNFDFQAAAATTGSAVALDAVTEKTDATQLTSGAGILAGDTISLTVDGVATRYTVSAGDAEGDILSGLRDGLLANGLDTNRVSISVTATGLALNNTTTADIAFQLNGTRGSGGLAGLDTIDVSDATGAANATTQIETFIQTATDAQAQLGTIEKRLEIQNEFTTRLIDSFKTGIGSLVDADLEEASARLQALQVQQQLGVQALSIANQAPQNILALFR